jgi:hypothetical protein
VRASIRSSTELLLSGDFRFFTLGGFMAATFPQPPFATIAKNRNEEVRLTLVKYRGKVRFDLRVYYSDYEGEFQPTQKGVSLSLEHYATFTKGMRRMGDFLANEGLLPEDSASGNEPAAPRPKPRRIEAHV